MLFLAGPHGAGKTRFSQIAIEHGCIAVDLGPTLRNLHRASGSRLPFDEWIRNGEQRTGRHFTDILLAAEIAKAKNFVESGSGHSDVIIVGSRSMIGIEYLSTAFPRVNGRGRKVVYVDAPFELKRMRYNSREGTDLSPEDFKLLLGVDVQMGLETVHDKADILLWNDTDENGLRKCVEETLL